MKLPTLSLVIPAYNEEERLPRTLRSIQAYFAERTPLSLLEIIVVDDGSRDATAKISQLFSDRLPVHVLPLGKNRGKGAASRAGVAQAMGDYVLLYDADAATPITELSILWKALQENAADIAVGSRLGGDAHLIHIPWHRRLLGRLYFFLSKPLVPGIEDRSCGCKLFRTDVARSLFANQTVNRFGFDVEVLSLAALAGYSMIEVPVRWIAVPGSKVRLVRDSSEMFLRLLQLYGKRMTLRRNKGTKALG